MESSTESKNQIQRCLDKLSEVAKTSEDRVEAVRMAWEGYDRGILPSTKKQQKYLQLAAGSYLKEIYDIFKARGFEWFEATLNPGFQDDIGQPMDKGQILWKQILSWPGPEKEMAVDLMGFPVNKKVSYSERPVFTESKCIYLVGYIATPNSLFVIPHYQKGWFGNLASAIVEKNPDSLPVVALNLFKTATRAAAMEKWDGNVVVDDLDLLKSCTVVSLPLVVKAENIGLGPIGQLELSLQDGQRITLHSNLEFGARIKEAVKAARGVTPQVVPGPGISQNQSFGTGFFVTDYGDILTCHHVIKDAKEITIVLSDGTNLPARLVQADKINDVAMLKVDATSKALPVSDSSHLTKGEEIFTLGYPQIGVQGQELKATFGRVNSVSGVQDDIRFIQIDVPIQPGNSGGPLIDTKGQVVGLVTATLNPFTAMFASGSIPQNVNYAIKADYFMPLVRNLGGKLKNGRVERQSMKMSEAVRDSESSVALVIAK